MLVRAPTALYTSAVFFALVCAPVVAAAQAAARPAAQPGGSAVTALGTPEAFVHESWSVEDGLPVNSVTDILQSRDGYIWVATFDGLARFDGVRFTVFNSTNSAGLPNNRITRLLETRDGSLWLRTEYSQLVRFRDGTFTHFGPSHGLTDDVSVLYEDRAGTLWVGTGRGLGRIRGERFVPVVPETVHGWVTAIVERRDTTIWAGLADGRLFRIERERATAVRTPEGLGGRGVRVLYEDPSGALWVGTPDGAWRQGAEPEPILRGEDVMGFHVSPRSGELWVLTPSRALRMQSGRPVPVVDRKSFIYGPALRPETLFPDGTGRMLFTSGGAELYRDGVQIYSLPSRDGTRQRDATGDATRITGVVLDREGSLWLGTNAAGLHRLKPAPFSVYSEAEGLSAHNVYSVYEDRAGTIWIGTLLGGTNRIDAGRITQLTERDGFPPTVLSFLQDRAGRLWLGGGNGPGIRVCAPPLARCTPVASSALGERAALAIHQDAAGALWFGTNDGLFRLDNGTFRRFTDAEGAPAFQVRAFAETGDGALWMGTNGGGLARYHQGRFTRVTTAHGLPFDVIRSLYQDADGWLWVGTEGRGLARLDPREWQEGRRGGRIVSYRMTDGLFDEVIHQILEDDFGRLWMSSNRGIFWVARRELLDFAAGRTTRLHSTGYTERDGLRNREANGGSQPAGMKARDGRLWFPTQDGVAVVDPARIEGNRIPPNVVIEQVTAGGVAMRPGHTDTAPLALGTAQRDLEIAYTALSFVAPANVRFRYRLAPYDPDWVDAGGRRTAFYTRVPPGRYTFRVIASNNDGVWNERGAALTLRLSPHLWETGAFRLLVLMALGTLATGGVRWRVRSLRARTRELGHLVDERTAELRQHERQLAAQAEQLQELDRAKSRFFANVSHEFRTPLTLTIGPLEDLRAQFEEHAVGEAPRQLEMALRNARRLLRLVNQILDVAKLEAGRMKLRAREQDLAAFARGVVAAFAPAAERKRIALDVTAPRGAIPVWFDPDALEKVLANLLSNALKFTPEEGYIELAVEAEPPPEAVGSAGAAGVARLRVFDSGPGIARAHLPHVFERFYQVDESHTRSQPGTGIGLALAKELVELHGGSIAVESGGPRGERAAPGATFTVTLPLGRAHLRDDQIAAAADGEPAAEDGTLAAATATAAVREGARGAVPGEDVTTLLIVEDSADLRAWVRGHFEPRYRVIEAADGAEGIERARALLPDLIISDVMMPGADGHALCRALRSSPETDFIPLILLTARASTEDRVAGLAGGADDYLAKPFEMRELEARVDNLIASRRRLRERFGTESGAELVELPRSPRESGLPAADRAFVERLRATIASQLGEPEFGVAELAHALYLDRSHLFRRTRELLGETPSDLIRGLRLERAAALLTESAGTVAEVAYGVGFQSVSHFSRAFLEVYGVRPSAYRDRLSLRG